MRTISLLALILITGFIACDRSEALEPDDLAGTWVEASMRKDTIIFFSPVGKEVRRTLQVNRGKSTNSDGQLLPKMGSGLYDYFVSGKQVYVRSLFSSSTKYTAYSISQQDGELRIANFFEVGLHEPGAAVRTFVRL